VEAEKKEELPAASGFGAGKSDLEAVNLRITGQEAELSPKAEEENKIKPEISSGNNQPEEQSAIPSTVKDATPSSIASARREQNTEGKIRIEDVKKAPKLTGPIDELGEMNLVDFRRLSPDPQVAAKKIKEKVEALEEEGGYARRLAGIRAWRQSPLNHLYLQIGQESINQKKSVKEIIGRRRENGEKYLTPEEFNAIIELNRELRF
jgi:hypothetical protein